MHSPFVIKNRYSGIASLPGLRILINAIAERFLYFTFINSVSVQIPQNTSKHVLKLSSNHDKNAAVQAFGRDEFKFKTGGHHDTLMNRLGIGDKLIVDAGANIGVTSVLFAMRFPDALIIAIEPESSNFKMLCKNTATFKNVVCLQAALSDTPERTFAIERPDGLGNDAFRVVETGDGNGSITTTSIPTILTMYPERVPFILKVDVEGYERKIFSGHDLSGIDAFPFIFVEPHDWMLPGERTSLPYLEFIARTDRDMIVVGDKIASVTTKPKE